MSLTGLHFPYSQGWMSSVEPTLWGLAAQSGEVSNLKLERIGHLLGWRYLSFSTDTDRVNPKVEILFDRDEFDSRGNLLIYIHEQAFLVSRLPTTVKAPNTFYIRPLNNLQILEFKNNERGN